MRSNDLQPTRLDRARFKILDLLALRTGARTGLIAYAGSAHIVVPPTKDIQVLKTFLESLDPAIMPQAGASAAGVLPLSLKLLGDETTSSTLLFVNDGFDNNDVPALEQFTQSTEIPSLLAWVMGTDSGGMALLPDGTPVIAKGGGRVDTSIDTALLRRVSDIGDMPIVRAESGDSDTTQILRRIKSNLQEGGDPDARWIDEGWRLLWPAGIICLFGFRKGWTQIL